MTTKKKPRLDPSITFDVGTLPFPEFMALLNAATLGAAIVIGLENEVIDKLRYYTARALDEVGSTRWNALMLDLQARSADAAHQSGVTIGLEVRPTTGPVQ